MNSHNVTEAFLKAEACLLNRELQAITAVKTQSQLLESVCLHQAIFVFNEDGNTLHIPYTVLNSQCL